jgi:predicted RNase H-like HicB family nuclease
MNYIAFIHTDDQPGFGISFPDFPGCISQGDTLDEALQLGQEALAFHVEGLEEDGTILPTPRSAADVWADKDLIDWREGAQLVWVPLVIDRGTPNVLIYRWIKGYSRRLMPQQKSAAKIGVLF